MSITTLLPLFSAVLVFFLGIFVLQKGKKERVNFTFGLFSLATTIWMFGTFMMFLSKDNVDKIIFWDKFVYIGVVFIPVIMLHFGFALTKDYSKKVKALLVTGYSLSVLFLILIPTKWFISGSFIYKWGAHTQAQLFHHIFLLYFVVYVSLWFIFVFQYYKSSYSSIEREKIKYSFFAFIILAVFGSSGYLPAYGIGIYPFAYISGVVFTIIIAYAIVVHRLMDIKLVMRRYSVYIISAVSILAVALGIKYITNLYFSEFSTAVDFLILVLAVLTYPSIKNYYYKMANKYFFSSLYDARQVISEISDKLRSTLDIRSIYGYIYKTLDSAFHVKSFGILAYSEEDENYYIQYNKGFNVGKRKKFLKNELLNNAFIGNNESIVVEEIKSTHYNKDTKGLIDLLDKIKVEIITPLNVKDKTVGLLVLGPKESGDMYNDEDLSVLKTVGAQAAIAIENALLYKESKEFGLKLTREVEKATHELRQANEKLTKLDKAKSEFISIASHQLRTPLTVIKGYISMILEGNFGKLLPAQKESLKKVFESGERLIQLVENLLNVSRIESGRLKFTYRTMQLEELVESVIEELKPNAKKKKLKFIYTKPAKALPKVTIDEEKLRQVVMNLIDNAIKYTEKGKIEVSLKLEKKNISFCVSDSGMGIEKGDMLNLFKKFSRGTGTSVVHTEGTGLGLYVAMQMIEAHKGKVWAESKGKGKGARFCFLLPVK